MANYGREGGGRSDASSVYTAPLRCADCFAPIKQKLKAKVPKYCPPCRHKRQADFKSQAKKQRRY